MFIRIRRFFAPPIFDGDEDKTRTARVLNAFLLTITAFLILAGGILVPFVFVEKLYNAMFVLAFLLAMVAARWLLQRGRVRLASVVFVSVMWIVFTTFLFLAGGMTSIAAVFYVAGTVVAGLLLGTRAALVHAIVCSLAGLVTVILEASGHPLPRLFSVSAIVGWVDMTISLLLTTTVLNLALRGLTDALALARQRLEEREQAEKLLRGRERDFATLVENATDMIVRFDADLRHVYCNPAVERQLGVPVRAFLGKAPLEREGPREQAEFVDRSLRRVLETGREQQVEQSFPTPSGLRHFQTRIVPELGPSGRIESLLAISRDITERKRAEEALRQSNEFLQSVLQNTPSSIFVRDLEGRYLLVNRQYQRVIGLTSEQAIGRCPQDLHTPQAAAKITENDRLVLESGMPFESEDTVLVDDEPHTFIATKAPLRDATGQPYAICTVATDITERKRAEEALQVSERRYRGLFEGVPIGLYRTTPEGQVLDANSALVEILGYPDKESLLAIDAPDVYVNPEDRRRWQVMMEHEGTTRGFEAQVRRYDGTAIWVRETAHTVRDQDGRVLYYEGSLENITERRQAELEKERLQERLIQAQKMEAVGRLAGGIAHDFNNVLTAIQGYGQFLLDDLVSDDPEGWPTAQSVRADLGQILKVADRAALLTQQLLAFSRKQVLQPRVLDLNDLLHGMENLLQRLIGEDIDLITVLAPDLGHVRADPGQIEQVIMNLSVNARDAMPRGGKLAFETANVELDETYAQTHPNVDPGRYVLLTVSDSGAGMSDEVKAHLFEPFFTTKEQGSGTGLGLATVYGIVEQSGGHIVVFSKVGVGTTFKVYLPMTEKATRVSGSRISARDMPSGTETVLLVEDERSVRDLICRVLGRCGYAVLAAGHPQEAMALSDEHAGDVHLLVTDVVMPGMGGKVLAERLVASRPQMKVLYISGYTDDAIVHHGVLDAGIHFVQKPFTPSALARKVREVLDASP
jgi:PAS domain S-box-containing protein